MPKTPDTPGSNLPFTLMEVKVLDHQYIGVALNFFDHTGGNLNEPISTPEKASLSVSVKTTCLKDVAKFWWQNTTLEKTKAFEGTMTVNVQRYLIQGAELLLRVVTLGFLQPKTTVTHGELDYQVVVTLLNFPEFNFGTRDWVSIENLNLQVSISAQLILEGHHSFILDTSGLIPDKLTPWQDDVQLGQKSFKKKTLDVNEVLQVVIQKAKCKIHIDHENRLVLQVVEADLWLELGDQWYQNFSDHITNSFLDLLEKRIISMIPPFVISPSLLLADTKIMGYSFGVKPYTFSIDSDRVTVATDLVVNELVPHSVPMPLYIGNSKSKRLHRFDCPVVEGIDFTHRLGYHSVSDGILEGFAPCGECLRGYTLEKTLQEVVR